MMKQDVDRCGYVRRLCGLKGYGLKGCGLKGYG